jgi:serine/threonine-protein kinase
LPDVDEPEADAAFESAPPTVAGYRVLGFIGAGGMASVFLAERQLPGGPQTVALKLLRVNVHDPHERQRFLREQQILARLQHPNIAQLLDAGFTPAGTPFIALEFVAGDTLLAHCDRERLSMRARLGVFLDVCAAVEHAHRNLVVHRDLKPGNVLVGADGRVKLLDFGIAKSLTGDDDATRTEAQRLTRGYAAPEQLAGAAATTAFDVYALGMLLGELLGGRRPMRSDSAAGETVLDVAIDEAAARARGLGVLALRRQLRGDLRLIVRKAAQADPARRYAGVAALRADVLAYLAGTPLQARPDTLAYRLATFVKRHVWAVGLVVLLIAILMATTVFSAYEAAWAHREAASAAAQARIARDEAGRADAVKSFLQGLFDSATPGTATVESAQELLARGRERADRDFANLPALRVEILGLIGDLERRSGNPERAREPLEQAAAMARQQFGPGDKRTLHVEYLIAEQADALGHFREGAARLQRAVDDFHIGAQPESADEVQALAWLAGLYERTGETDRAVALGGQTLALARRVLAPGDAALDEALTNVGWILMDAGRAADSEPLLGEALASKRRRLGEQHADVADAMDMLATALLRLGRYGEAEALMRAAVAIDARAYARPHARVVWHLGDLGVVLVLQGKLDEGADCYRRALAMDRALFPGGDLNGATTLANIARVRLDQGLYVEAEAAMREAIAQKTRLLGVDYADNGDDYDEVNLARMLIPLGKLDEAQLWLDAVLADGDRRHGGRHTDVAFALFVEAQLLGTRGDHAQAVARAREAVALYDALMPAGYAKTTAARLRLGEELQALGHHAEAQSVFGAALAQARAAVPPVPVVLAHALADVAGADAALGDTAQADTLRRQARAAIAGMPSGRNVERDAVDRLLAGGARRSPAAAESMR